MTTNSVAQGEHVGLMFPMIFAKGIEIGFAYTSFKWENNAKRNAGVTVAVIGLRTTRQARSISTPMTSRSQPNNINGYLADGANVVIERRKTPLGAACPEMVVRLDAKRRGRSDPVAERARAR